MLQRKEELLMESYNYLFDLAVILISTKLLGLLTKKFQMPQVVGALLAGLLLGPAVFNVLKETDFIHQVSEIGVIVLMFNAGLETDIRELKNSGKASFLIALIGVIVPLIGGFFIAYLFNQPDIIESDATCSIFLQNMFIGVILTATSVSITVETLKEMGKLNTRAGNAILGAAIIDDILGIVALTIITSMADPTVNIITVLLKIASFFVFAIAIGMIAHLLFKKWTDVYKRDMRRFVIVAFVFCLILAYCAEVLFGVADITGAYIAGLMMTNTRETKYLAARFDTLSYMMLSPIFFASIGLKVILPDMTLAIVIFAVALVLIAVLTKVIGCGFGGKVCGYTTRECVQIGVGMVSRGEVALIVASKGAAVGLMSSNFLGPVVIVVVVTTIIAPILLKIAFKSKDGEDKTNSGNKLTEDIDEIYQYKRHPNTKESIMQKV